MTKEEDFMNYYPKREVIKEVTMKERIKKGLLRREIFKRQILWRLL